jgi:RHS repeat-associated protein
MKVRQGGIVQDGRRGCRPSTQAQLTPKEAVFLPCDNSNIQSTLGLGSVRPELKNYARRHITAFQSVEDLVNRRKRLQFDISFDLALGGKRQCFGHILARADKRPANGNTVRHDIEERHRKLSRRQPDQHTGSALARHGNALLEGFQRRRRNQYPMGTPIGRRFHRFHRVAVPGIDHTVGTEAGGMRELAIINVNRADLQTHGLSILDRQMPEATGTRNGDPFSGTHVGFFDSLVGRDARTDDRRGLRSRKSVFYAFGPHGSAVQRLSSSRSVMSTQGFDAYGSRLSTDSNLDAYAGYGGQSGYYTDWETGTATSALALLTFRYYDPSAGRFLTRDPIAYKGGANSYKYVNNGPGRESDAQGTEGGPKRPGPGGLAAGCLAAYLLSLQKPSVACNSDYEKCKQYGSCIAKMAAAGLAWAAVAGLDVLLPEITEFDLKSSPVWKD